MDRIDNQEMAVTKSQSKSPMEPLLIKCSSTKNLSVVNEKLSPIQEFYHGQSIFITGGTGFIGKLVIEKLLRICPGLRSIYLLVRSKKSKNVHQRIEEIFDNVLFERLKKEQPKFWSQIVAITGDCSQPNLGISSEDRATLIREVSIVFHIAATVRFYEKLKLAVAINVRSTRDILNLCKEIPNLKSFVYVSTAFSNCPQNVIEEKFYDAPVDYDKLLTLMECMEDNLIEYITPQLLGKWPNTYTFTKAVAEDVIKKQGGDLPIGIFRPAIIISTYQEPIRGWIDNLYGPTGITVGAGNGFLRCCYCDGSASTNVVPADLVINALIACAWDTANVRLNKRGLNDLPSDIPIYNYVSKDNPITYDELKKYTEVGLFEFPSNKAIWYYSFRNTKNRLVYLFFKYFCHLFPALLIDIATVGLGKKSRLLKLYKKMHTFLDALSYFSTQEWIFTNDRLREMIAKFTPNDHKNFYCDMKNLNWKVYFRMYFCGIRVHLIKDSLNTLPQARAKWQRLYWCHQALKCILAFIVIRFCWLVISMVFNGNV